MFEAEKTYHFRIVQDGVETEFAGTVESYDGQLIKLLDYKLEDGDVINGAIINVRSPNFVSAVASD